MQRIAVESKAIRSMGYDASSLTLEIEFRSGRVYQYLGVPASVHAWLLRAPDKGGIFNRLVRDHYEEREVTQEPAQVDLEALLRASVARGPDDEV